MSTFLIFIFWNMNLRKVGGNFVTSHITVEYEVRSRIT